MLTARTLGLFAGCTFRSSSIARLNEKIATLWPQRRVGLAENSPWPMAFACNLCLQSKISRLQCFLPSLPLSTEVSESYAEPPSEDIRALEVWSAILTYWLYVRH